MDDTLSWSVRQPVLTSSPYNDSTTVLGNFNVDLFRDTSIAGTLKAKYHLVQLITAAMRITKQRLHYLITYTA